jgi:hypothetical protein
MERATLVILPGVLIALAAISWAVPLVGAAHFPKKTAAMAGLKPLKSSTNSQLAHSNITVPMPVRFREARDSGLLVRVWINGSGPYTFAVDTGAGITVITDNLVQQARLQVTARRHMLTICCHRKALQSLPRTSPLISTEFSTRLKPTHPWVIPSICPITRSNFSILTPAA